MISIQGDACEKGNMSKHCGALGFPGGSDGKASACNARDPGLTPGLGRSPGVGNGNSLQYSCLENSVDRGTWWATVHEVSKDKTDHTQEWLLNMIS